MPDNKEQTKNRKGEERKSIFNSLFSRPSRDEAYLSDLKAQWAKLDLAGRIQFVLGAILGLALFIGALLLAYFALSSLVG